MFTCTKKYTDFPFAHRQHRHEGHCRFIHGHNWGFTFTFACTLRDFNGFVIDFGDLKWLKEWLTQKFDHTLVLNQDDPHLDDFKEWLTESGHDAHKSFADIRVVPNCGAEGLAVFIHEEVDRLIRAYTNNRVWLASVIVHEDEKNSAQYTYNFDACHHNAIAK